MFLLVAMVLSFTAVLTLFTFVESQKKEIESQFDEFGANIIITPKTDNLSLTYGGVNLSGIVTEVQEIKRDDLAGIKDIPNWKNIRSVSPKLLGVVKLKTPAGDAEDALMVGVDFEEEMKIKSWWQINGEIPANDSEILLGADTAEILGLEVGTVVTVKDKNLRISGIIGITGSQDDTTIFASTAVLEGLLGKKGVVSLVEVSALCSDCPLEDIVEQISAILPSADVKGIRAAMQQRMNVVNQFSQFAVSICIILILLCGLLVFSNTAGSVSERHKEIGVFRALGFHKKHIISIILSESFIVSLAAGVIGVVTALLSIYFLLPPATGIAVQNIHIEPIFMIIGVAAIISVGFLASIAPAIKASDIDPVAAINSL